MGKKCDWCGKPLEGTNPLQRFCSDKSSCRVAAWRARHAGLALNALGKAEELKIFEQR